MADTLTTITNLINSPPGQLAAGGVLFYGVQKFFKELGDVLSVDTNREITRWLKTKVLETGLLAEEAATWPRTFTSILDRVFGERKWSWKALWRSGVATISCIVVSSAVLSVLSKPARDKFESLIPAVASPIMLLIAVLIALPVLLMIFTITNIIPDYLSLLKTRMAVERCGRAKSGKIRALVIVSDILGSLVVALSSNFAIIFLNWCLIHPTISLFPKSAPAEYKLTLGPYMAAKVRASFVAGVIFQYPALSFRL